MGLELLMALAEESEVQLTRAARTAMLEAIGEYSGKVLQLLGTVLAANLTAQGAHLIIDVRIILRNNMSHCTV